MKKEEWRNLGGGRDWAEKGAGAGDFSFGSSYGWKAWAQSTRRAVDNTEDPGTLYLIS